MTANVTSRKPGRPPAIPNSFTRMVLSLHCQGFGYRAIARELMKLGVFVDWSTVRRFIKANSTDTGDRNAHETNFDTILPLGSSTNMT